MKMRTTREKMRLASNAIWSKRLDDDDYELYRDKESNTEEKHL